MRYIEYMKLSTRCAVLKQQIDRDESDWTVASGPRDGVTLPHKKTGIVYDKRILGEKVDLLNKEIKELEHRLENDE